MIKEKLSQLADMLEAQILILVRSGHLNDATIARKEDRSDL